MVDYLKESTVSLSKRIELIRAIPCFSAFSLDQVEELATLMKVVYYSPQEKMVIEKEIVDSIFILVSGEAEVTQELKKKRKVIQVPIAILRPGEGLGLSETGFYSSSGHRTATVTAITNVLALYLSLKDLHQFLNKYQLEQTMRGASLQMLRMAFIKQSLPFSKISPVRLQWLAEKVEAENAPAGTIIFKQGEKGDKCYLIYSGLVEITVADENAEEKRIALLKPPVLFGEATLITSENRNATARAVEDCELLVLHREHLSELIEAEKEVAHVFMNLMVDRSRPLQNPDVTSHQRETADGDEITILKNENNRNYFKLSREGKFIWDQLTGKHTLQDITLSLAEQFNVFAPDVVVAIISKLTKAGFVENVKIYEEDISGCSFWRRWRIKLRNLAEFRKAFGDADPLVTRIYKKYIHYLFSFPGQLILIFIAMLGFFAFVLNTEDVLLFFGHQHASILLLLGLIPLSLATVVLHELGHAFAVKAYGREVHYIGIGWHWIAPIAFTDTSDMWLATRKPRLVVNLAGVFVDILVAGFAALGMFLTDNFYILCMLWLFSLYTYIGAFRHLSPLQEMDGYYALMDWVEKNHLRQSAVLWLLKGFPKALRKPSLFYEHKAEVIYWLACLFYIVLVSILTLTVQMFIFYIFGVQPTNPYITLALPVIAAIISSLGIIADIRKADER